MNTMQTNPQDILKTLSLSFEVFPPKKWEDFPGLYETLDELKGLPITSEKSFIICGNPPFIDGAIKSANHIVGISPRQYNHFG